MPAAIDHPADMPTKLNLGCGFDKREGYLNVDFQDYHEPDLVADVLDLEMLPSGYFTEILAIDVLEHLERIATAKALTEWHRLLAEGGTLHLQVPDVAAVGRLLQERDTHDDHEHFIHHLYGTQAYTGDFHLAGFTDRLMIEALLAAGFDHIVLGSLHSWLLVAEATKSTVPRSERSPLVLGFGPGTYPAEADEHGVAFRWCAADAEVLLANITDHPIEVELKAGLSGLFDPTEVPLHIEGLGPDRRTLSVAAEPVHLHERLTLPPGGLRLRFRCDGPRLDAPGDLRELHFRLVDLSVTPV